VGRLGSPQPSGLADGLAKLQPVMAVGIEGDALTDRVMDFPSLIAAFDGVPGTQPGTPLNVKGSARWVGGLWEITDASMADAEWRAPLGLRFVTATEITRATGSLTGQVTPASLTASWGTVYTAPTRRYRTVFGSNARVCNRAGGADVGLTAGKTIRATSGGCCRVKTLRLPHWPR
jgi:hypothetical protein